jgi:RHS repeat-associated protein
MTQYQFNMGTGPQSETGALTWNANGTLSKLVLTDQINTANSQTCKYGDPSASVPGYDDLGRIISANCASAWSQTFAFDPFGNLKKTGSAQFLPTYTGESGAGSPINRYFSIPGGSVSYDGNGNLTNDVTHSYTWDADGNMLSTDGTTVTMMYDAMDRMIEQTRGSSHTEIAYGPYGMKLALMNGQTLVNAFVKLPGGSRAVYDSSGLAYYRHSDHLGSSRLATTPSRTKYYDVAYAPYGEDYNGSGTTPDLAFTDQNQDTVKNSWSSNLYDFMFREYRTAHGRWTSPDPAGLGVVDPTNPQTWNRYADVLNNPLANIDLLGLCSDFDYSYTDKNGFLHFYRDDGPCPPDPNPSRDCSIPGACNPTQPGNNNSGNGSGNAPANNANNGTPTPKNPCVADALKAGATNVGIDLLGFLPEAGGVARVVGHQAGYVGKVADNLGKNMLTAGTKTTGTLASAIGFSSSDWTTWVSAGITAADFVPVLSDFTTPVAIAWDAGVAAYKVYQCPK